MRIHVTYTGGTIGMVDSPRGLVPGADPENRFDAVLKEAGESIGDVSLTALSPLIDSSDATPESWQRIILCRSEERRVGKECRSRWSPYH